jgi:hypothetical protein
MTAYSQKDKNDNILDIIKVVDKNYKENPIYTILTFQSGGFLFYFLLLYVAIVAYFSIARNEIFNVLTLLIAILSLSIAHAAWTSKAHDSILEERNYYFISRGYSEKTRLEKLEIWWDIFNGKGAEEEPLLKALVKMKARNPRLKLEDLYNRESSLFSEKKLLEKLLYE